ncbi:Inositol-3-phosphate synthase [Bythopirellula polymerisocia]|uniref:Inositol-3-phosphate synthase n=2 Tax=Bythopirellula polymerisocia TaxID=2528003 RepID=A0A5C6D1J6_9BACT|nr:Inositol-3-phosphate synthase [Bythopirellula polymerisocia]
MSVPRIGIWIIGARGGVSVTTLVGLSALRRGVIPETGLVSSLADFAHLPLAEWDQFVVGGHEIRSTSLLAEAERLHRESRVIEASVLGASRTFLSQTDANIRPGVLWNVGSTIRQLADGAIPDESLARSAVDRIQRDLKEFQQREGLDKVVVVNLASTEALLDPTLWPETWSQAEQMLEEPNCSLPASSLYAIGALELGMPYINFTPSLGATPLGIDELAKKKNICHAGRDAKTGETLLKSVLAPMFAARNLEVMSWVGHNIFGNLDGKVLSDPENKASKVKSKDQLLERILGYPPQSLVSIEHIGSLGDWKTAWDHVHFRGFLQTPMTLQLTWQGCDSLLAAPLVLDLVRFVLVAQERGETGALGALGSFFKSPLGTDQHGFADQTRVLLKWSRGPE